MKVQKVNTTTNQREIGEIEEEDYHDDIVNNTVLSQRQNKAKLKPKPTAQSFPFLQNAFKYQDLNSTQLKAQIEGGALLNELHFQEVVLEGNMLRQEPLDEFHTVWKTQFVAQEPGIYWIGADLFLNYTQTLQYMVQHWLYLYVNDVRVARLDGKYYYEYYSPIYLYLNGSTMLKLNCGDKVHIQHEWLGTPNDALTVVGSQARFEGFWLGNNCRTEKLNNEEPQLS